MSKEDFDDLEEIKDLIDNKISFKAERITQNFIIYDDDTIFNFNINDISIYENPYPIFKFEYRNGYLYIYNKTTLNVQYFLKGKETKSYQMIINHLHLSQMIHYNYSILIQIQR